MARRDPNEVMSSILETTRNKMTYDEIFNIYHITKLGKE